jgi:diguanylate cyclase (GGDEF)-like protein
VRRNVLLALAVVPAVSLVIGLVVPRLVLTASDSTTQAGPLLVVTAGWLSAGAAGAALGQVLLAGQTIGPLRKDVVWHAVATVCGLGAMLISVFVFEPYGFAWAPVIMTFVALAGTWPGRRGSLLPASSLAVLDIVPDALVVISLDGQVVNTNAAADDLVMVPDRRRSRHHSHRATTRRGRKRLAPSSMLDPVLVPLLEGDGERTVTSGVGAVLRVRTETVYENNKPVARILSARDITELDRLRFALARLAARDSLTGLLNRFEMSGQLEGMVDEARRTGRPLSLAMVDMDHLKTINDTLGHQVGDRALVAVAKILSDDADDDLVVRVGGDEFLVALAGTTADAAELRAQLWRVEVGRIRLGPDAPHVTLSVGIARLEPAMDVQAFISAADGALYAAKAAGRNRVRVRTHTDPTPVRGVGS